MRNIQLLFIVLCAVASSLACSCRKEHTQTRFCTRDFAVLAYVESPPKDVFMPNNPYQMPWKVQVYTVRIRVIFRGQEAVKETFFGSHYAKLYTPAMSCKVTLMQRKYYAVFGEIRGGKLYTSTCDRPEVWSDLTSQQQLGLYTQYKQGCECPICYSPNCPPLFRGCSSGYDINTNDCRAKYQRCEKQVGFRGNSECAWVGSKSCDRIANYP